MQRRAILTYSGRALLLLGALMVAVAATAHAEIKPLHPLGVEGPPAAAPPSAFAPPTAAPFQAPGPLGRVFAWVFDKQQSLQRTLAINVKSLKTDNPLGAAITLALLSFIYGVLHAVGPGHGKTIISSYVIANEETVRRGVIISFIAAGLQALTAVVLVGVLLIALGATGLQVNAWSNQLETISYAMIALVGLYLLSAQLRSVWRRWQTNRPVTIIEVRDGHGHSDHHHHDAHHSHHHHGHGDRHHEHHHHHTPGEACDHMVDVRQLDGPVSWRKMMAVVFSVGIRPCTGAILVLVFALTQGLFWAGVAATFAMAVGTAITVAVLATLAIGSRELALKLGGTNSTWTNTVWSTCAIGGATVILLFGVLMFTASLGPARPF
jgi:ABC-type nickel/cobalt efflux system permease component RcnA